MGQKLRRLGIVLYLICLMLMVGLEVAQIVWAAESDNLAIPHGRNEIYPSDFVHFYIVGKLASSAQRHQLYDKQVQNLLFEEITKTQCRPGQDFFTPYFPLVFLLMIPFTFLPLSLAHIVFILVTTTFGVAAFFLLIDTLGYAKFKSTILIMLGILASNCSWRNWSEGQMMWFYVGLVALYLSFYFKKFDLKGGFVLAFCIIKPQYALYLATPLLALKRWRLIFAAFISAFVLMMLVVVVCGWNSVASYSAVLHEYEIAASSVRAFRMYSIRTFLEVFLPRTLSFNVTCAMYLICLVTLSKICFDLSKQRVDRNLIIWLFTTCILASMVFSPHEHLHDLLLLAIPALLTLPMSSVPHSLPGRISLSLWRWILFLFPMLSWLCFFLASANLFGTVWLAILICILFICAAVQLAEGIANSFGKALEPRY